MSSDSIRLQAQNSLLANRTPEKPGHTANVARARKMAEDYEGFFIGQMLKPMFEGLEAEEPFGGGPAEETWRSMQVDEYGKAVARRGGIGLADSIFRQILKAQETK